MIELFGFGTKGWGLLLLSGALITVLISVGGFILGSVIGTFIAWAKISGGPVVRFLANSYTTILRGVPELLVIYLFYFGGSTVITAVGNFVTGGTGFISFPGFWAGTLAVGVLAGAQLSEVFRGGFYAVSRGEIEAAHAYGMSRLLRFRRVIAPLTFRYGLPAMGNVWQSVLKESALVSVTGVAELLRQAQIGAGSTGRPFDFYIAAAILYLTITSISEIILKLSEKSVHKSTRPV